MLENGSAQKLVDAGGTPAFMAPELCSSAEAFSGQLADIWAIGATMYMLRFGQPPFVASNVLALYNKILNDPLEFPPVTIDPGLRNLLVNMLEKDPNLRYNMDQITSHPWLRFAPRVAPAAALFAPQPEAMSVKSGKQVLQLPDQYFNEEAEAMKCPKKTVDKEEIYRSIGFGVEQKQHHSEDDQEVGGVVGEGADDDEDIMATNWASDVFEQVDDADLDSSDDDSVDDEDEESPPKKVSVPPKVSGDETQKLTNMDESEQDRRSKEFKQKLIAKSSATNFLSSGGPLQPKSHSHPGGMKSVDDPSDEETDEETESPQRKKRVGRQDSLDLGDLVEELSMNDFEDMMDTLAMRPVSRISHPHQPTNTPFLLENVVISSPSVNVRSGLGGIAFSDQGCRRSQEDRPVLVISFERDDQLAAETGHYEYLLNVSVAAVFDGHSGDACSEFLSKNFIKALLMNQHFYSTKTLKQSMIETCSKVDLQVDQNFFYLLV
jgi:serine/threonine protein kinase